MVASFDAQLACMITLVLGLQFGDEGKGKIVDYLSESSDAVIKFNGGSNAGHTVVTDEGKFKFHLVPSGALRAGEVILGNGMTIDPFLLDQEMNNLSKFKEKINVKISKSAHVVTPMHRYLDQAEETARGSLSIGTTAQGIGPTYEDKYARTGIRIADLSNRGLLEEKIELIYRMKRSLLENSEYASEQNRRAMAEKLYEIGLKLKHLTCDTEIYLNDLANKGKNLLFEGSHGSMLDVDFGTYPFVTSSNTTSGAVSTGSGLSLRRVDRIVGVVNSYMSRVGFGPFPTELPAAEGDRLRTIGNEYGTTTGRPRRVGWLDLVLLKYTIMINDVDSIALTRVDTLGKLERIKIGYEYVLDGKTLDSLPKSNEDLARVSVKYRDFKSWGDLGDDRIREIIGKGFDNLPAELKEYIDFIEQKLGKDVDIISLGEKRSMTLFRKQ